VHAIPEGSTIEEEEKEIVIKAPGQSVRRVPRCGYTPKLHRSGSTAHQSDTPLPKIDGWTAWAQLNAVKNRWGWEIFNRISGTWTVPNAPQSNGATIFLFNGMQMNFNGGSAILQPVLQYGVSAAGGGNSWKFAPWYYLSDGSSLPPKSLLSVSPGNLLQGTVRLTSCGAYAACTFEVTARQLTGGSATATIRPIVGAGFRWAFPATLEVYNVTNCSQLPNQDQTMFSNIFVYMPGPDATDYNEMATTREWSAFVPLDLSPACGYSVTNNEPARSSILGY
jgi:hypothetical protein